MAFRPIGKNYTAISKYYKMKEPQTPHDKVVVWQVGERLEGRYVERRENGEYVSYILQLASGELISLPKTHALEETLSSVAKGSLLALTNEGKRKLKGGKTFNDIKIEIDDASIEEMHADLDEPSTDEDEEQM